MDHEAEGHWGPRRCRAGSESSGEQTSSWRGCEIGLHSHWATMEPHQGQAGWLVISREGIWGVGTGLLGAAVHLQGICPEEAGPFERGVLPAGRAGVRAEGVLEQESGSWGEAP